jgi:hypothetical protein
MEFNPSMFEDLNSDQMHLLTIEEPQPNRFYFSLATNGQWLHGISVTFNADFIDIFSSTDTNADYLNQLDPFVARIKEILSANPLYRLQMIYNDHYCKEVKFAPHWCSSDFKYALIVDDYSEDGFGIYFKLKDAAISAESREIIGVWSYENDILSDIEFSCEHPPVHLKTELERFTANYLKRRK